MDRQGRLQRVSSVCKSCDSYRRIYTRSPDLRYMLVQYVYDGEPTKFELIPRRNDATGKGVYTRTFQSTKNEIKKSGPKESIAHMSEEDVVTSEHLGQLVRSKRQIWNLTPGEKKIDYMENVIIRCREQEKDTEHQFIREATAVRSLAVYLQRSVSSMI